MSRERALTVPEEAGAPTAATHAPLTRSEVEPVVVVETWALLGTVMLGVVPPVSWTVTAVPLTAVTTPRTLSKSEANPPGVPRGWKVKSGRPPSPPGWPPANDPVAQAPLTAGETVTRAAVIVPVASALPVGVMQLPTAMSAAPPMVVTLIGVELVKSTVTSPLEVLSTRLEPLRLTRLPSVRSPLRNPPYPAGAPLLVVPQAASNKPSPPRAAIPNGRARAREAASPRPAVPICVASNSLTPPETSTGPPDLGGGAGRDVRPAPPRGEVGDR